MKKRTRGVGQTPAPDTMTRFRFSENEKSASLLSRLSRLLLTIIFAISILLIAADALALSGPLAAPLLLVPVITAALTLIIRKGKGRILGLVLAVLTTAALWIATKLDPIRLLVDGIARLWNRVVYQIDRLGYVPPPGLDDGGYPTDLPAMIVIAVLITPILFFLIRKRTHFFALSLIFTVILAPLIFYQMIDRPLGLVLLLSSIAGAAALRLSEKRTETGEPGLVGGVVCLLSFLLMILPMTLASSPWREIDSIGDWIDGIREDVIGIAEDIGILSFTDGPSLGDLSPRRTTATRRIYFGRSVMRVYSDTAQPIYLRSFYGGRYENGTWFPATVYERNDAYDPSNRCERIPVETLMPLIPGATPSTLGLFRSRVVLQPTGNAGTQIAPIPYLSTSRLTSVNGVPLPDHSLTAVSDYLYATELSENTPYMVEALLPFTEHAQFLEQYAASCYELWHPSEPSPLIPGVLDSSPFSSVYDPGTVIPSEVWNALISDDYRLISLYGYPPDSPAIDAIISRLFLETDIERYFTEFSAENAVWPSNTSIVRIEDDGDRRIFWLNDWQKTVNAAAIADTVASFLRQRCRYTLSPSPAFYGDPMEEFLFGSCEGYCVQFATASTLILRKLGLSARYVEGFLTDPPRYNRRKDFDLPYAVTVRDSDAHSWTEIWINGFGWWISDATPPSFRPVSEDPLPAETTAPESETLSPVQTEPTETRDRPETTTSAPETARPSVTEPPVPETAPAVTSPLPPEAPANRRAVPIVIAILAVLILSGLVGGRAYRRYRARQDRIKAARKAATPEKRNELGLALSRDLLDALKAYRLIPGPFEMPGAFAARAAAALDRTGGASDRAPAMGRSVPSLGRAVTEALSSVNRRLYGGRSEESDLAALAFAVSALTKAARVRLGLPGFLWHRVIRCLI